jgi:conjugative relaxase-like TrwC/TraI family protein
MSIRRISLGSGYKYLMSSVARGDGASTASSNLTRYYAESGTPPGWFLGAGLAGLANGTGLEAGSHLTEEHLFRMLGMLQDPVTGEQLGRPPTAATVLNNGAARRPVAGFDLTFSVPKSVSAMWAVADATTQRTIYEAHVNALKFTISYAERHVFSSRSGKGGVLQEDVRGVVAAAFDHWDSRAGDPQLHTHVAVLNRAQIADGSWKTLDSRSLFKSAVTLSALYNGVLSDYLTAALGVGWEPTSRGPKARPQYEIIGVPEALREEFSQRTKQIDTVVASLAEAAGRDLTERERLQLRQQATLMTRPDKQHHSLAELTATWRKRAAAHIDADPVA